MHEFGLTKSHNSLSKVNHMKDKPKITFDVSAREFVLGAFDKKLDDDGYVVESADPEQKVIAQSGQDIRIE